MRLARLMIAILLIVALLTLVFTTVLAEGKGRGLENNPGQGHDWIPGTKGNNNADDNTHHSENGYWNHLPSGSDNPV